MADQERPSTPSNIRSLYSTEYFFWEVPEYPYYERSGMWYAGMMLAGIGLLIYAVVTANFLFALIIIMFALILYLSTLAEPRKVRFVITDTGVALGNAYYPYKEISRYWFIYEPPNVRNLYLDFKSPVKPRMSVDIGDMNPNDIRQVLANFVHEDFTEDEEPFSDYIGRLLKI